MAIFILLPFIAFYFGMQYQKNKQNCAVYSSPGQEQKTICATCRNNVCEPYETCSSPNGITTDCGPLYCPNDCEQNNKVTPFASPTQSMNGTVPSDTSSQQQCEIFGGKWLPDHNECEGLSQLQCQEVGGTFAECASPCRHDPNAEVCVQLCVPVCSIE